MGGAQSDGRASDAVRLILQVRIQWSSSSSTWVNVTGELDLFTAPTLVETIAPSIRGGTTIVFDLSGVTFLGAAGISGLLRLRACANQRGCNLFMIGTSHRAVHLPLVICHLERLIGDGAPTSVPTSE